MELSCLVIRGEARRQRGSKYPAVVCAEVGRPFPRTREALIFPHFVRVHIKGMVRLSDGRFRVFVKGAARKFLTSGSIIVAAGQPVYQSRVGYAIARRPISPGRYRLRGGLFREHRIPGVVGVSAVAGGYRLSASTDLPLTLGGSYRLYPPEGPIGKILPAELLLCVPLEVPRERHRQLGVALDRLCNEVSVKRIAAATLCLLRWVALPAATSSDLVLDCAKTLQMGDDDMAREETKVLSGPLETQYLVEGAFLSLLLRKIEREIKHESGATIREISRKASVPADLIQAVVMEMERNGEAVRSQGHIVPAGARAGLSPMERELLERLRNSAHSGTLMRAGKEAEREILHSLVRRRVAVQVGDRFCAVDSFESLARRLLAGRKPGEAITIAEARALLALPREQVVRFMESLDDMGVLRRDQNRHRVASGMPKSLG